jgi:hypothetical protein
LEQVIYLLHFKQIINFLKIRKMKKLNTLTPGTLHSSQVFKYRTKDGRAVFAFSYEYDMDGYYDIVIHDHPDFNGRDESSTVAHWLL